MTYQPNNLKTGATIEESHMKNIDNGIVANEQKNTEQDEKIQQVEEKNDTQDSEIEQVKGKNTEQDNEIKDVKDKTEMATTEKAGIVKQAAAVPEAASEQVTGAEFKALLDSLKAAGIMAS